MAVDFIGSAADLSDSLTLPSHEKGDCMFVMATRAGNTAPALPSGWITAASASTTSLSARVGFRIAHSSSETSGTWTNATGVSSVVFRPTVGTIAVPVFSSQGGTGTTVSYVTVAGVASADNYIDQSFCAFGITTVETNAIETPPTGMTFLDKQSQTGLAFASFRLTTNAFGNWSTQSVTLSSSSTWRAFVFRLAEYPFPAFGAGGFRPVNIRGGADQ